jgi:hypothetical protein
VALGLVLATTLLGRFRATTTAGIVAGSLGVAFGWRLLVLSAIGTATGG